MSWIDDCNNKAKALTREKRQEFLDLLYSGKNLGDAAKGCGIDSDTGTGIININTVNTVTHTSLRRESV